MPATIARAFETFSFLFNVIKFRNQGAFCCLYLNTYTLTSQVKSAIMMKTQTTLKNTAMDIKNISASGFSAEKIAELLASKALTDKFVAGTDNVRISPVAAFCTPDYLIVIKNEDRWETPNGRMTDNSGVKGSNSIVVFNKEFAEVKETTMENYQHRRNDAFDKLEKRYMEILHADMTSTDTLYVKIRTGASEKPAFFITLPQPAEVANV